MKMEFRNNCQIYRLFADDTAVYLTVRNQNDSRIFQNDLKKGKRKYHNTLQEREQTWDVEFSPSKCQVLQIGRARQPIHLSPNIPSMVRYWSLLTVHATFR